MPITKERLAAVVDETYVLCERFSQILANVEGHLTHPSADQAVFQARLYIKQIRDGGSLPEPRIAYAERRLLDSKWGMNEWRKNRRAAERAIKRAVAAEQALKYNYDGKHIQEKEDRFVTAEHMLRELDSRGTTGLWDTKPKSNELSVTPLTADEAERIARPDDASALPLPDEPLK